MTRASVTWLIVLVVGVSVIDDCQSWGGLPSFNIPFKNLISSPTDLASRFKIPDPASLIPNLSHLTGNSTLELPKITGFSDLSKVSGLPGVSAAIQLARDHVQKDLKLGDDLSSGLERAVQEALKSHDPTSAIRDIVKTVTDTYVAAATDSPLLAPFVIPEGISIAVAIGEAVTNIVSHNT